MDPNQAVEPANSTAVPATMDEIFPSEATLLRRRVLDWLKTMRVEGGFFGEYRMNAGSDATVFNSCFAVFIRHLFGDLASLPEADRKSWLEYFQGFQDEKSGLFIYPEGADRMTGEDHDPDHLNRQLSTFCVSAMRALGGGPRYPFAFLDIYKKPGKLVEWLEGLNWNRPWNCGNKVMFAAILLIDNWERFGDQESRELLDVWLDWFDRTQNPKTGFWGKGKWSEYIMGMGGFYHMFVVYNYMRRKVNHADRVVDRCLLLQQANGLYTPNLGGATCDDIDGLDPLVHFYYRYDYRRADVRKALRKALPVLLDMQNEDGGFCWAKPYRFKARDYVRVGTEILRHGHWWLWYWNARRGIRDQRQEAIDRPFRTGWNGPGRLLRQSSLFDTWLRCTTIGEVCSILTDEPYAKIDWQFLTAPGVGWFRLLGEKDLAGK